MAAPKNVTPAQIINHLRKAEVELANGKPIKEICRGIGVSEQTYYRWRREYGGMKTSQAKRMKELEKENQHVSRHARAGRVEVNLRVVGEDLLLDVVDNGIGITVDQVQGRKSFGLMGMRERAGRLGGELEVQRREEGGTRVRASVPLSPDTGDPVT